MDENKLVKGFVCKIARKGDFISNGQIGTLVIIDRKRYCNECRRIHYTGRLIYKFQFIEDIDIQCFGKANTLEK
jgi:hypothetical protein